jgi:capsular polysaccharide transport system permease protein
MQLAQNTLLDNWTIQKRVIHALLMREIITRFGRHNIGFLWLFLEPILFTLGVVSLWTFTRDLHGFKVQVAPFVVTGYSTLLMWRNCSFRGLKAIESNRSLMYHRNVRIADIFIARMLLEVCAITASFAVVMITFLAFELILPPADTFLMLLGWFVLCWFSVTLGVILGCLSEYSDIVERLWHPTSYFMLTISGAFFMVDWLPIFLHEVATYVPMLNATEMIRGGYFGERVKTHYNGIYAIVACTIMTIISLILLQRVRRLLESRGQ